MIIPRLVLRCSTPSFIRTVYYIRESTTITTRVRSLSLSSRKSDGIVGQKVPSNDERPRDSVETVTVSDESRVRLLSVLKKLPSPYKDYESHCSASHSAISSQMSPGLIAAVHDFHSNPTASGALLITGLPLDPDLPVTPADGERSREKASFVSEGCLTGIAKLIGSPFCYASEKNGEIIHNVCPVKHRETLQTNESSKVELSLHVENAYFDARPDYLALYCLRQDHEKKALTSLVDIRAVLAKMDPVDVTELQKPVFIVPSPQSHHIAMGQEEWSSPRPLYENPGNPKLTCHFPGMKALDPKAQNALDRFEKTARRVDVLCHIALQPGNLLLINNHKVAHGRSSFIPRYQGDDRWLQRVYIREAPAPPAQ